MKAWVVVLDTLQKTTTLLVLSTGSINKKKYSKATKNMGEQHTLSYRAEISKELRRILNSLVIRVFFKTSNTLGSKLVKSKDLIPTEKQTNCVYKINCRDCEQVYIGQTSRQLSTRINENRLAFKWQPRNPMELKRSQNNSAVAAHSVFTRHQVNFADVEIIQRGFGSRESLHITANKNCVNCSSGLKNHPAWQIVMDAL